MKKLFLRNEALPRLGDFVRPSISMNKEIVSATNAGKLGDLFEASFNAKVGILAKSNEEIDRLHDIAQRLLHTVPKDKLNNISFILVDEKMDLRHEVFISEEDFKNDMTEEQIEEMKKNATLFLSQVIQRGCILYSQFKDPNWNKEELRNELEKMKEFVFRYTSDKNENKQKKPNKPLLFSKKKDVEGGIERTGNLKHVLPPTQDHDDRAKLLFTTPRAREDSLPNDLIKDSVDRAKTYSFLDLLAADGYATVDLETCEQQVILKLDKLREHILHQFDPVFNELNAVRKRIRHLSEQSTKHKNDRKSIMK